MRAARRVLFGLWFVCLQAPAQYSVRDDLQRDVHFDRPPQRVFELDVEEIDGAIESFEAGEFLRDVEAVMIGDLDVATLEHDFGVEGQFGRLAAFCRRLVESQIGIHGKP